MDFIRDHQVFNAHVIWSVWKLIKYYNYEYYNQLFQNFMVLLKGQDSEKKVWQRTKTLQSNKFMYFFHIADISGPKIEKFSK